MNNLKIISNLKWRIVLWILLFTIIYLAFSYGKQYGVNERIIILATLVLGVFTQIFTFAKNADAKNRKNKGLVNKVNFEFDDHLIL